MLLTVTSTAPEATDLGFLLHKHPAKVQAFDLPVGTAHVFYPEATAERCTVALLLEIDPVALVRGRSGSAGHSGFSLAQYVNDRPYAASSMLAAALGKVFRTAIAGRCTARPELPEQSLPLVVEIPALPSRGGPELVERLFRPLGWDVDARPVPLDPTVPAWGDSRYVELRLSGTLRLAEALSHLYVLLPVLDADKHYWVGPDEIDKLLRAGDGWLAAHPDRELIAHRYLAQQRDLTATAVERLEATDVLEALDGGATTDSGEATDRTDPTDATDATDATDEPDASPLPSVPLARLRADAVLAELRDAGARTVVDLGCGEGALLARLLEERTIDRVLGVDVSHRALETAASRLHLDTMPEHRRARIELAQSSLTYSDARVAGFDAAVLMEVIEHVDPPRLAALERAVLGHARPGVLVVTTPNAEHNVRYARLVHGTMRHTDHRFEWTRAEFEKWASDAAARHGYAVRFAPVGVVDPEVGPPTQMAVLTRTAPEDGVSA
ncbi:3' terminal RNA ribose 2'-O-methyltransferase Hen1 [Sanguibacter sp. 25GB23B1]|uniref:3' terminal RNA ribose 2'-O-methyltransferase Hen1 n=1 Tax=unclassified Sanguibacter TaxID=2645534 RepID=UPI0032AFAEFA